MNKFIVALALAIVPAVAFCQTKIATIDMAAVVHSHPLYETNKAKLKEIQSTHEATLKIESEKFEALQAKVMESSKVMDDPAASAMIREAARVEGKKNLELAREQEKAFAALRRNLQKSLAESEMALYSEMMEGIMAKVESVAKSKKAEVVLDSSSVPAGSLAPLVVWGSKSLDITEDVVKALGGKIVKKDKR